MFYKYTNFIDKNELGWMVYTVYNDKFNTVTLDEKWWIRSLALNNENVNEMRC